MIVLDASAVIEFLLRTPTGDEITGRIAGETLAAPHLVDVEVAQVMRRYERARAITTLRTRQLLLDLVDLDATRYPHDVLVARVWQLRGNLTAYDAVYVSLAEGPRGHAGDLRRTPRSSARTQRPHRALRMTSRHPTIGAALASSTPCEARMPRFVSMRAVSQ
jgi:predicted nucleic acid-binding protein